MLTQPHSAVRRELSWTAEAAQAEGRIAPNVDIEQLVFEILAAYFGEVERPFR
ncbi:hypothetical protein M3I53_16630 [Paraburkholderia sp. CNPSo 3272]|uniref:hypothetical protein n=1 Tax=Paraburkholderia sp. CNPSo 3272 TaxID=2940931 RepID=UPI0020B73058|nr:hypothetical protein [Paraburkholderia sp. CNPSo 3272]MCP3724728.1 hypothetical protein [Paraburkholderia sp. CNPSo 3272]